MEENTLQSKFYIQCSYVYDINNVVLRVDRPTMGQLRHVMRNERIEIATNWYDLGLELVHSHSILKVIETNHPSDVETCCCKMFQKWLERTPDASWNQLITALNNIEMKTAANAVSELFQSG